jgi:DNA-binding NtrC family response regulator
VRALSADAKRGLTMARWPGNVRELENTMHRAVLLAVGPEIGAEALRAPDGARMDSLSISQDLAAQAAATAEALSRTFIGRTVADVERDLILQTLDHCFGNRTHAATILGISIRTLRNKLRAYQDAGVEVAAPGEVRAAG